ncbi:MAG: YafY family transcriptional regulator [Clostridia bacterium]|nr:YafY family transcriptional regulator [Clostridia bacterium]
MKLDRLLAITMLLMNRNRVDAKELAEQFEVSVRTIYRDIDAINQAGIPVVSYQGVNGGFGIMENYRIDRRVLSADDLMSIISALNGVSAVIDDRKMSNTLEKIKGLVPEGELSRIKKTSEQIIFDFGYLGYSRFQKDKFNQIKKAIEDQRIIKFHYSSASGSSMERSVEPMNMILKGYAWYLYGFCLIRKDFRMFRLSRMRNLRINEEKFALRERPFEDFDWDGLPGQEIEPTEITLKFSPKVRVKIEDFFGAEAVEECPDGFLLVRTSYPVDDWVYGFILGYGENVEVLEPEDLRRVIKEKAEKIATIYKK